MNTSANRQILRSHSTRIFTSYNSINKDLIMIRGIEESETWELFDFRKNKVLKGKGIELNLKSIDSGIYLLKVRGEQHCVIK